MTAIELIQTLTNSMQVVLVDKSEEELIAPGSAKWFKKFFNDKYQQEATHYLNMKVFKHYVDEYGRTIIVLNYGLTKRQQEIEDKKFMKEHNGKTREEVAKENHKETRRHLMSMMAIMNMFGGFKY